MEKKNGALKVLFIIVGVFTAIVGAMAIFLKVFSKFFKITIEICPEEGEDSDELCCENSKDDIEIELSDDNAVEADDEVEDEEDTEIEVEMLKTEDKE